MDKPRRAAQALWQSDVLSGLASFQPRVVSTLFNGLHGPDSDVDIVCHCREPVALSVKLEAMNIGGLRVSRRPNCTLARWYWGGIEFELYACAIPVERQNAVIHYRVMNQLLDQYGEAFRRAIVARKRAGWKTEPAIADWLGLSGDPYQAVYALSKTD